MTSTALAPHSAMRRTSSPFRTPFVPINGNAPPVARRVNARKRQTIGNAQPPPYAAEVPSTGAKVSRSGTRPMKRPIMQTASAPPVRAATARAGRLDDSPVSLTQSCMPSVTRRTARTRSVSRSGSVSWAMAPGAASDACGAPTFNSKIRSPALRASAAIDTAPSGPA